MSSNTLPASATLPDPELTAETGDEPIAAPPAEAAAEPAIEPATEPLPDEPVSAAQDGKPAAAPAPMSPEACAQQLKQLYPALFRGGAKPLKLRIQADIQERAPGVFTKSVLSAFFRRYTGSTSYLLALSNATQRFDLDGAPAGELAPEHRQAALDELARRRTVRAEREQREVTERRERASLLHDFQNNKLTTANFCALKGIEPDALEGLLAQARQEAAEAPPRPMANDRRDARDSREPRGPNRRPGGAGRGRPGPGPNTKR